MLDNFNAYRMAKELYRACKRLRVNRILRDQLIRASSSVVLNLAEGSGKRTAKDQRRFYGIAFGSLREVRAIIEMEEIEEAALHQQVDALGAILYVLSGKPSFRRIQPPNPAPSPNQTEN